MRAAPHLPVRSDTDRPLAVPECLPDLPGTILAPPDCEEPAVIADAAGGSHRRDREHVGCIFRCIIAIHENGAVWFAECGNPKALEVLLEPFAILGRSV